MIEFELEILAAPVGHILHVKLLLGLAYQSQIAALVKVVICLQQDDILSSLSLLVIELQDSLQILGLKVFLL